MKKANITRLICSSMLFFCITSPVLADIAPPLQPPGGNPGSLEFKKTKVAMTYEAVFFDVGTVSNLYYDDRDFQSVNAHVIALFLMKNQGETTEQLETIFPLSHPEGRGDGAFGYPEVQNFNISINDTQAEWRVRETPNQYDSDDPPVKWAAVDITYPPSEVVAVEVSYDVQSTGYLPEASFYYVLSTGAGWYGPIEEANIFMAFPYEATEEFFLFGPHGKMGFEEKKGMGVTFEGNRAHWEFKDIEPKEGENWGVSIIEPETWQKILTLRKRIEEGDIFAYSEITIMYEDIIFDHWVREGSEKFVLLNLEMYKHAIENEPQNDDVFAHYAQFIYNVAYGPVKIPGVDVDLQDAYNAAETALAINPDNQQATQILHDLTKYHDLGPVDKETEVVDETADQTNPSEATEQDNNSSEMDADGAESVKEISPNVIWTYFSVGLILLCAMVISVMYLKRKKRN